MTDHTLTEQQLEELRPLAAVIEGAIKDTPIRLGTDDWGTMLAAGILVRVAAYMGGVLPPTTEPGDWLTRGTRDLSIPEQGPAADDDATTPTTTWTPGPVAVAEAAEWARQAGKASAAIEALTANAGCSEHPNAGSVGPYCLACTIVPPPTDRRPPMDPVHILGIEAPAADEDAQRTVRRERLLNLLARLQRGGMTAEEKVALRQHVDAEMREHDGARTEAQRLGLMVDEYGQGARHLSEELRKARRAADLLAESHRHAEELRGHLRYVLGYRGPDHDHTVKGRWDSDGSLCAHCARIDAARAALDGTEQPTTEA